MATELHLEGYDNPATDPADEGTYNIAGGLVVTHPTGGVVSGTGGYTPFLRQNVGGQETASQGFNTDDAAATSSQNSGGLDMDASWTQSLLLGDLPIVYRDGIAYYEIRLDLNEPNSGTDGGGRQSILLGLTEFQLYTSEREATLADYNAGGYETKAFLSSDFHLVYDLDAGEDRTLVLADGPSGSGNDDYSFYLPVSSFGAYDPTDNFTLFAQFGPSPAEEATFEEWRIQTVSRINGVKFNDLDGDGVKDAGENGLAGFTMYIDANNNNILDLGEVTAKSDANGSFTFYSLTAGTYVVREILALSDISGAVQASPGFVAANYLPPSGTWDLTTGDVTGDHSITITTGNATLNVGNQGLVSISGTKYLDANGDGQTTGDVGLGGVTIFIDMDNSGTNNAGDITTTTAADGTWSLTNLSTSVNGHKVYEVLPSGYVQTLGTAGYTLSGDATNLNFANFDLFTVSGTKYNDANGDGSTVGDVGLGGVTIFIDMDGSGTNNAGDITTTTAANGTFSFTNLGVNALGKTVYEVLPSGYVQTLGAAGYTLAGTSQDRTGVNFANFDLFTVSGTKYNDANGDGSTVGDVGLGGVTIFIDIDGSGTNNAGDITTTTAANGTFSFADLGVNALGKTVYEVLPSGYVQTLGAAGYTLAGTSQDQTGLNFANFNLVDLSGTKYLDANGDGSVVGDVGLAGVTIFIDLNNNGINDEAAAYVTTTGVGGAWSFTGLGSDVLGKTVYEVVPGGYTQTLGTAGYVISGDATGLNFANHLDDLGPGVRTPGFWQNMKNGGQFWDGITGNEKNAGQDCFADGELLYQVDSNNNGSTDTNMGLLIGDYNQNGLTDSLGADLIAGTADDVQEDTIFISYADARTLINANESKMMDGVAKIGRDVVATWLNYLAGNGIGDAGDVQSPHHFIDDAIDYLQIFGDATAGDGVLTETFDVYSASHAAVKTGTSAWTGDYPGGGDHSGSDIHSALDYYNNTGMTSPTSPVYAHDCDDMMFVTAYGLTQDALI